MNIHRDVGISVIVSLSLSLSRPVCLVSVSGKKMNKKKPKKFAGPFQLSHSLLHCAVLVASIYLQLETDADKQTCNTPMQPVVFGV